MDLLKLVTVVLIGVGMVLALMILMIFRNAAIMLASAVRRRVVGGVQLHVGEYDVSGGMRVKNTKALRALFNILLADDQGLSFSTGISYGYAAGVGPGMESINLKVSDEATAVSEITEYLRANGFSARVLNNGWPYGTAIESDAFDGWWLTVVPTHRMHTPCPKCRTYVAVDYIEKTV